MDATNFCYWLQGAFELGGLDNLNSDEVQIVKDHLALVFNKVTPQHGITFPPPPVVKGPTEVPSLKDRFVDRFGITNTPFIAPTITC